MLALDLDDETVQVTALRREIVRNLKGDARFSEGFWVLSMTTPSNCPFRGSSFKQSCSHGLVSIEDLPEI